MPYCERCMTVFSGDVCPECGKKNRIRELKPDDPCLLGEFDSIWSEVLTDVLTQNGIPFMKKGRLGAGLAWTVGPVLEKEKIYVPASALGEAKDLAEGIFEKAEESEA